MTPFCLAPVWPNAQNQSWVGFFSEPFPSQRMLICPNQEGRFHEPLDLGRREAALELWKPLGLVFPK